MGVALWYVAPGTLVGIQPAAAKHNAGELLAVTGTNHFAI